MKPYKSLFKENGETTEKEAKQIINISNLEWSKSFQYDWNMAQSKCPTGYRLPTIQELHSAYKSGMKGFKADVYWSSSIDFKNSVWIVHFLDGTVGRATNKNYKNNVRYVKNNQMYYDPKKDKDNEIYFYDPRSSNDKYGKY